VAIDSDQRQEIIRRLDNFLNVAIRHRPSASSSAPWSLADIDEIAYLARLAADGLPEQFNDLIATGIPSREYDQGPFAERLLRVLKLTQEFGDLPVGNADDQNQDDLAPTFSLDSDEATRVVELTTQMRKIVFASTNFDAPHKKRLLDRIAAIEKEVHQPKGKLDVVLAGISDLGDTLKKFGGDLKPLSDRYAEVVKITRSRSKEYDQLPAPDEVPGLPAPDEQEQTGE
jgi:hypothetical protein